MKIVVVGFGKIGYELVQQLSKEGHDIVVIDKQSKILHKAQEDFDVAIVAGNGVVIDIQKEAGVPEANLMIAATPSDEINLLCCTMAKKSGCKHTIARVRNPEYDQQVGLWKEKLGLSRAINPEKETAREILRLLQFPSFLRRDAFGNGRVELVEFKLGPNNTLNGRTLEQISRKWSKQALICTDDRDGEVTIPYGGFELQEGDKLTIAVDSGRITQLLHNILATNEPKISKVMIIGGSRITIYLASLLLETNVDVTIIENDAKRCLYLSEILSEAMIIHGDGTSQRLLLEEGIEEMDAVVSLTGIDEENIIISMFANNLKVTKTITKINRIEYTESFSKMGIDTIVSPRSITANQIVGYVRAMNNRTYRRSDSCNGVETLYKIVDGKAEALSFTIDKGIKQLDTPLSQLSIRKNILIASIIREGKVIIPGGDDHLEIDDAVVVVVTDHKTISTIEDIFSTGKTRN